MKRPLATAALGFLAVTAVAFLLSFWAAAALVLGLLLFALFARKRMEPAARRVALAAALLGVAALMLAGLSMLRADRAEVYLANQTHTATLLITDKDAANNRYTARIEEADDRSFSGMSLRFYRAESYEVGDELVAAVEFYGRASSSSTLDETARFNGRVTEIYEVRVERNTLIASLFVFRSRVAVLIRAMLPGDEGRFAAALVTGNKSLLTADMQLWFQRAGISHIVVVSGLHITVLLGLVYWLAKKFRARWLQFLLLALAAAFCMLLYGVTPSVVRACIMSLMVYGGGMLLRKSDAPTTLALAAMLILAANPAAVSSASFLLSFGCCFALMVAAPAFSKAIFARANPKSPAAGVRLKKLVDTLGAPLCITAVTFPVLVLFGMPVSLASPLVNLVVVPLVPLLMVLAMATALLQWLLPFFVVTNIVGFLCGLLARAVLALSRLVAGWSFAAIRTTAPFLKWWVLFALIIVALAATLLRKKLGKKLVAFALLFTLAAGWGSEFALSYNTPCAVLYNGQAVAVLIRDEAVLIVREPDESDISYLKSYLQSRFVRHYSCVIITGKITAQTARVARDSFAAEQLLFSFDYGVENAALLESGLPLRLGDIEIYVYPNATTIVRSGGVSLCFSADAAPPAADIASYYRGAEPMRAGAHMTVLPEDATPPPGAADTLEYAFGESVNYYFAAAGRCNILKEA